MEEYLFGSGEPYFGSDHPSLNQMSEYEIDALELCKIQFIETINPFLLLEQLFLSHILSKQVYANFRYLRNNGVDERFICRILFNTLPFCMNFCNLVRCLDNCKYINLSSTLFWNLFKVKAKIFVVVQKASPFQRPLLRDFSRKLKRTIHNSPCTNRKRLMRFLAKFYKKRIVKETDTDKRQLFADKYITVIAAEIDVCAITFDENLHKSTIFKLMKKMINETSNTLITDIGVYGRLANAYAIAGIFSDSDDMLMRATCMSYHLGPGIELFNLFYTHVYVRLWKYEQYPTLELRDALMFWGRTGLRSLQEDDNYSLTVWKRNLITRMVYCLLGLGNRTNIIKNCIINIEGINEASKLLQDFEKNRYGIEIRRLMLYNVAKARFIELTEENYLKCLHFLQQAVMQAESGRFEELRFIKEYHTQMMESFNNAIAESLLKALPWPAIQSSIHAYEDEHYKHTKTFLARNDFDSRTNEFGNAVSYVAIFSPSFQHHLQSNSKNSDDLYTFERLKSPCGTYSSNDFHQINEYSYGRDNSTCSTPSFHSLEQGDFYIDVNLEHLSCETPPHDTIRSDYCDLACNFVPQRSSFSTPSFHSYHSLHCVNENDVVFLLSSYLTDDEYDNEVLPTRSACYTPSFHSYHPHLDESQVIFSNIQSLSSTPSIASNSYLLHSEEFEANMTSFLAYALSRKEKQKYHSYIPRSILYPRNEPTDNHFLLRDSCTTPSFHSLYPRNEPTDNHVFLRDSCTTPSFHSLYPRNEPTDNHVLLRDSCTTPFFNSLYPRNELMDNHVLLRDSCTIPSFRLLYSCNEPMTITSSYETHVQLPPSTHYIHVTNSRTITSS
ncbi:uncharacterized protein LOC132735599 [Ruditapes philippinarum]|uniref:uncharacterized protein LOC132735599 n=1 Tax=Ruditapes philippinarum TaxID=129788 RepID=UPI00295AC64C|nr:uncharacterized protein LOC132735599 [Ruditapes philippinarum]